MRCVICANYIKIFNTFRLMSGRIFFRLFLKYEFFEICVIIVLGTEVMPAVSLPPRRDKKYPHKMKWVSAGTNGMRVSSKNRCNTVFMWENRKGGRYDMKVFRLASRVLLIAPLTLALSALLIKRRDR